MTSSATASESHVIPAEIREKIEELGFHAVNFVPLADLYSVIAIRNGQRYNIQIRKNGLGVDSISLLKYRFNANGGQIMSVKREVIQKKN